MPAQLMHSVWTREEWQKARIDKGKNGGEEVPKGAALRVSIGADLDKLHSAMAQGVKPAKKAAETLKKDLAVYLKAVKKKYPHWHARVQRQLEHGVDNYIHDADKVLTAATLYAARLKAANTAMMQTGADFVHWEKATGGKGRFTPSNEKIVGKALEELMFSVDKMPYYTDKISLADAKKFHGAAYNAASGADAAFSKPTMNALLKMIPALPSAV